MSLWRDYSSLKRRNGCVLDIQFIGNRNWKYLHWQKFQLVPDNDSDACGRIFAVNLYKINIYNQFEKGIADSND